MSTPIDTYIDEHRDRFLDELKELCPSPASARCPSTGPTSNAPASLSPRACAKPAWSTSSGFPPTDTRWSTREWMRAPGKPTVLCYGHYDVQPPDPLDEWITPPFEPAVRDDNIYARGAADDKGQMYIHIKAAEALLKTRGTLP